MIVMHIISVVQQYMHINNVKKGKNTDFSILLAEYSKYFFFFLVLVSVIFHLSISEINEAIVYSKGLLTSRMITVMITMVFTSMHHNVLFIVIAHCS